MSKTRLFIFPHAGSSANLYLEYKKQLSNSFVECFLYEYKGHGARYGEEFSKSIQEVSIDFLEKYSRLLEEDYIFLGHSYGTNVILDLCNTINCRKLQFPKIIYLSSGSPIHEKIDTSKEGIRELLLRQNMTASNIMTDNSLFDFFFPIIQNDINNLNNYKALEKKYPIEVSLFSGNNENIDMNKVWKDYYRIKNTQVFDGGHEYILKKENVRKICDTVLNDIKMSSALQSFSA